MNEIRATEIVSIPKIGLGDPKIFGLYKELRKCEWCHHKLLQWFRLKLNKTKIISKEVETPVQNFILYGLTAIPLFGAARNSSKQLTELPMKTKPV